MPGPYRLNSPPVVLETVDEETIIVNLDSGCYYDLNHSGGRILAALASGAEEAEATRMVAADYGIDAEELSGAVGELAAQLLAEGILLSGAPASSDGGFPGSAAAAQPPARPFEAPALGRYTDMQELLLLDPIHEVDESGWPNRV